MPLMDPQEGPGPVRPYALPRHQHSQLDPTLRQLKQLESLPGITWSFSMSGPNA